jgi:glycosyltransferase involved in cell wall biosynthesis
MRSLDSAASIVGPDVGAFRDLAEAGLVRTYRDPSEMIEVVEKALAEGGGPELMSARRAFFERTSWARQTGEIARVIRGA